MIRPPLLLLRHLLAHPLSHHLHLQFEPAFDKTRNRWRVVVPAGMSSTGKRIRCWHKTRDAARSYVASITAAASPAATIPPRLAAEADEARLLLEPLGRSLPEAARELAAVLRTLGNTGTPLDAAKAWRAAHDQRSASKRFWDAAEAFLATREELRPDTLRGYRDHLKNGLAALHNVTLSDVTAEAINKALADRSPAMRKAIQTTCGTFIRWAATPPRQWCNAGILEGIDPVRITLDHDITVLTAAEARAVLHAAEAVSHPTAAALALALFGGIRLRELGKLTWAAGDTPGARTAADQDGSPRVSGAKQTLPALRSDAARHQHGPSPCGPVDGPAFRRGPTCHEVEPGRPVIGPRTGAADLVGRVTGSCQVGREQLAIDVAVVRAVRVVAEVAVFQFVAEKGGYPVLRLAFGFADGVH